MPNGDVIEYEYHGGNVNKLVNDMPQRLMESVDEFSIDSVDSHLFKIHIKTFKEGKVYDFKVERRRGGSIRTDAVISSISPAAAVFDKNILFQDDVDIILNLNGNDLKGLRNDLDILNPMTDYSISSSIVTIKKEYLPAQPIGTINIAFDVTNGVDPVLSVEIRDTSTYLKVAGNSYEDDLVRMDYPGNLQIDSGDNQWVITVTNGTVANDINSNDLAISGLPSGINATAAKATGNRIIITLSGTAAAPVTAAMPVGIIVKGSGVNETAALDSDPIEVFLLPGASYASPEHNMIFTNELYFKNNVTITGDIVIGRGESTTYLDNNCNIYGYVYVDSSLHGKNNLYFGKPSKPTKVFVKGSAIFDNNTYIYGDLFYRDSLEIKNNFTITGEARQSAVEIPPVTLPQLKSEQWYRDNGYTIVSSSSGEVNLLDNGKYYFKDSYTFRDNISGLDNILIVGEENITFKNNFSGSGIIFAPNGKILFENNCTLTGMCISKSTVLDNNGTLIYKRYAELPFD
jgi:hypothetical protein